MVGSSTHFWTYYSSTVTIQECVTCSHRLGQSTGWFSIPLNQQTHAVKHTPSTSDTTEKHLEETIMNSVYFSRNPLESLESPLVKSLGIPCNPKESSKALLWNH
ncbi:hypothetical protein PoB_005069100 [Plakobranchus ocellatus]|uniref:Protein yippee-like n=1 Tax=Plakobranchus ocellatus TaxID=259542 RepID=A0AAV4BUL5_9GAST|nr:hypothetical protein PoB_005069100 [Plakobranchus ocellatus]